MSSDVDPGRISGVIEIIKGVFPVGKAAYMKLIMTLKHTIAITIPERGVPRLDFLMAVYKPTPWRNGYESLRSFSPPGVATHGVSPG